MGKTTFVVKIRFVQIRVFFDTWTFLAAHQERLTARHARASRLTLIGLLLIRPLGSWRLRSAAQRRQVVHRNPPPTRTQTKNNNSPSFNFQKQQTIQTLSQIVKPQRVVHSSNIVTVLLRWEQRAYKCICICMGCWGMPRVCVRDGCGDLWVILFITKGSISSLLLSLPPSF